DYGNSMQEPELPPYIDEFQNYNQDETVRGYQNGGLVEPDYEEIDISQLPNGLEIDEFQTEQGNEFPLEEMAEILRNQGRYGDSVLVHINQEEFNQLQE